MKSVQNNIYIMYRNQVHYSTSYNLDSLYMLEEGPKRDDDNQKKNSSADSQNFTY